MAVEATGVPIRAPWAGPREPVEVGAARLRIPVDTVRALTLSLGCKVQELQSVSATDDGLVVDVAGVVMIYRPPTAPDGAGMTGWMRVHPHTSKDPVVIGRTPVFTPTRPTAQVPEDLEPVDIDPTDLEGMSA
jgi:hypothetical protein